MYNSSTTLINVLVGGFKGKEGAYSSYHFCFKSYILGIRFYSNAIYSLITSSSITQRILSVSNLQR